MKAVNVRVLDVRGLTDIADTMIVASGNSDRHVRSIADRVFQKAKAAGFRPLGTEGARDGEWVLVDLHDVLVHVMLPRVREFYGLERLWEAAPPAPVVAKPAAKRAPCGATAARRALVLRHACARDCRGHAHARLGAHRLRRIPRPPGCPNSASPSRKSRPARAHGRGQPRPRDRHRGTRACSPRSRPGEHVVALDERGKQSPRASWPTWLSTRMQEGEDLAFVIGGPDGHAPEVHGALQQPAGRCRS